MLFVMEFYSGGTLAQLLARQVGAGEHTRQGMAVRLSGRMLAAEERRQRRCAHPVPLPCRALHPKVFATHVYTMSGLTWAVPPALHPAGRPPAGRGAGTAHLPAGLPGGGVLPPAVHRAPRPQARERAAGRAGGRQGGRLWWVLRSMRGAAGRGDAAATGLADGETSSAHTPRSAGDARPHRLSPMPTFRHPPTPSSLHPGPPCPTGMASLMTSYDGGVEGLAGTPEFIAPDVLVSAHFDGAKAGRQGPGGGGGCGSRQEVMMRAPTNTCRPLGERGTHVPTWKDPPPPMLKTCGAAV